MAAELSMAAGLATAPCFEFRRWRRRMNQRPHLMRNLIVKIRLTVARAIGNQDAEESTPPP